MIDRQHDLSITQQARLLGISRSSVYYLPRPASETDLALMRRLDELHLEHPFMGARMLRDQLHRQGIQVGRKHITTLMLCMGIAALAPQPGTSKRAPGHKVYPYLLRQLAITRSNQVWALDTTYIPMARGFVYLTAVVDVFSRRVLAHRVAITLEAIHAKEVIQQALAKYGTPEIVNTDQGSQFTAEEFTRVVRDAGCKLSMDGRGAWRDNVFVERLWRSAKYERVYLKAYDSVSAARADIADYLNWYNTHRAHSSLDCATPDEAYFAGLQKLKLAAQDEILGAPRVNHRVGRLAPSADRRRGQLCIDCNPPAFHLRIGECCSDNRSHFCPTAWPSIARVLATRARWVDLCAFGLLSCRSWFGLPLVQRQIRAAPMPHLGRHADALAKGRVRVNRRAVAG